MLAVNAPHAVTATAYDRTTQRFERMRSHLLNAKTARIFSYFMRFYERCFSCFFLPWQLVSALLGRWVLIWVLVISPSVHKIKPNWILPKILNLNVSNFEKSHCFELQIFTQKMTATSWISGLLLSRKNRTSHVLYEFESHNIAHRTGSNVRSTADISLALLLDSWFWLFGRKLDYKNWLWK